MKDFEAAKSLIKDSVDPSFYFDSISSEIARKKLYEAITQRTTSLIFVIGEPGVGKSHILRLMHAMSREFHISLLNPPKFHAFLFYLKVKSHILRIMHAMSRQSHISLLLEQPFFDLRDLYKVLYEARGMSFDKEKTFLIYQEELFEAYVGVPCTIFLDEAQLLSEAQLELIRVLSDTKLFQFILAMHTDEGKALLSKKQFETRSKIVIEYGNMEDREVLRYIQTHLLAHSLGDIALLFSSNHAKIIGRYAQGNFRVIKKFLYTLMKLLDFAQKNGLSRYAKINICLLDMTALDCGLLHDK